MRRDLRPLWPAALAAAGAVTASLPGARSHALWGDEVASARVLAEPGISDLLDHVRLTESTPPAWYVLGWVVSSIVEPVERVRLLSVLFAAAAAALTALWAARLLGDRRLGAVAGLLLALGSAPAAYAEQLRAYALLTLLSVLFGLVLLRTAELSSAASASVLAVTTWAAVMTHYFFFFTAAAAVLWLWVARPALPGRRAATVAMSLGVVGFVPWLPSFLEQLERRRYGWIGEFDFVSVVELPGALFFGPEGLAYGIARVALVVALAAGALTVRRELRGGAIAALALLPPAGAAIAWAAGQPVFNERNLLATAPYMGMLVAAGLSRLPRGLVTPFAAASIAATSLGAAYAHATLGRTSYDMIADAILELGWNADDALVLNLPRGETSLRFAVAWYLPGQPVLTRSPPESVCDTLFTVGHESTLGPWLERHRIDVEGHRELVYYDHPVRGRPDGKVLVVRVGGPIRADEVPGDAFNVRGAGSACKNGSSSATRDDGRSQVTRARDDAGAIDQTAEWRSPSRSRRRAGRGTRRGGREP
jgi:hypothetical protein